MEIVVNYPKAFPRVVAPVSPAHQELNHQTHVNQSDFIVWRQMTLLRSTETKIQLQESVLYVSDQQLQGSDWLMLSWVDWVYLFNISNQVQQRWVVGRLFLKTEEDTERFNNMNINQINSIYVYLIFYDGTML